MLQIQDFPKEIETSEKELLGTQQKLIDAQAALDTATLEIDKEVAFNAELKNEQQRKVARLELMLESEYQELVRDVRLLEFSIANQKIEISSLQNQFAVVKLLLRKEIAQMESQA